MPLDIVLANFDENLLLHFCVVELSQVLVKLGLLFSKQLKLTLEVIQKVLRHFIKLTDSLIDLILDTSVILRRLVWCCCL